MNSAINAAEFYQVELVKKPFRVAAFSKTPDGVAVALIAGI